MRAGVETISTFLVCRVTDDAELVVFALVMGSTLAQQISRYARKKLGYDFFISYSRKDASAYARELHRRLEEGGYLAFIDREEIHAGNRLSASIRSGIRGSRRLLFIDTPRARSSRFVLTERRMARARRLREIRIVCDEERSDDAVVWIPEVSLALEHGLPSDATIRGVTSHAGMMRSRFRFRAALVLIALVLLFFAEQRLRHTIAAHYFADASAKRMDQTASIADMELAAATADWWESGNPLFEETLMSARRVMLKQRGGLRLRSAEAPSGDVKLVAVSGDDPLTITVVTSDALLRGTWSSPRSVSVWCSLLAFWCGPGSVRRATEPVMQLGRVDAAVGTADGSTIAVLANGQATVLREQLRHPCSNGGMPLTSLALSAEGTVLVGRSVGDGTTPDRIWFWNPSACESGPTSVVSFVFDSVGGDACDKEIASEWRGMLAVNANGTSVAIPAAKGLVHIFGDDGQDNTVGFGEESEAVCTVAFLDPPDHSSPAGAPRRLAAATPDTVNVFEQAVAGWARVGARPATTINRFFPLTVDRFLAVSTVRQPSFGEWSFESQSSGSWFESPEDLQFGRSVHHVLPLSGLRSILALHDDGAIVFTKSVDRQWARSIDAWASSIDTSTIVSLAGNRRWLVAQTLTESIVFEVRQ